MLQSSVQSGLQSTKAPPTEPAHPTPPTSAPSHSSPGSIMPLPHALVVLVVLEVVVVVVVVVLTGDGGVSATTSRTNASTLASIVALSFIVAHPPRASALSHRMLYFCSAFARQVVSAVVPLDVPLAWHLSFAAAFLPAARSLLDAQSRAAWVPSSAPAGEPVSSSTTSSTKASTLFSMLPLSLVVMQPPL